MAKSIYLRPGTRFLRVSDGETFTIVEMRYMRTKHGSDRLHKESESAEDLQKKINSGEYRPLDSERRSGSDTSTLPLEAKLSRDSKKIKQISKLLGKKDGVELSTYDLISDTFADYSEEEIVEMAEGVEEGEGAQDLIAIMRMARYRDETLQGAPQELVEKVKSIKESVQKSTQEGRDKAMSSERQKEMESRMRKSTKQVLEFGPNPTSAQQEQITEILGAVYVDCTAEELESMGAPPHLVEQILEDQKKGEEKAGIWKNGRKPIN